MKNRLIFYFLFLPFILFMAWSGIGNVLNNLLPISVAVIISVIILALFKTPIRKMFRTVLLVVMMVAVITTSKPANAWPSWRNVVNFGTAVLVGIGPTTVIGAFSKGGRAKASQAYRESSNWFTGSINAVTTTFESGVNAIDRAFGSETAEAAHQYDMSQGAQKAYECLVDLNKKEKWDKDDYDKYATCSKEYAKFLSLTKKACPTLIEEIKNVSKKCWVCDISKTLLTATEKVMTRFHNGLNEHKIPLTMLAFGLFAFLMFHFLGLVMSLGTADIGQFFTTMFQKILLVMFVATLFYFPYSKTIDLFLTPLFSFGAALTQKLNEQAGEISAGSSTENLTDQQPATSLPGELKKLNGGTAFWASCDSCKRLADGTSSSALHSDSGTISPLPGTMKDSIDCMLCNLYVASAIPSGMGSSLACNANSEKNVTDLFIVEIPNIMMLFTGWIVRVCFFIVSLIFAIAAFDSIFRLTFLFVLLPIFMTAAAFKSTRQYTVNAFNMFLHAIWTLFVLTLLSQIVMTVFYSAFADAKVSKAVNGGTNSQTLAKATAKAIMDNDVNFVYEIFKTHSSTFWMSVFVVVLSYFLIQMSKSLIDALGPSGSSQISSSDSASNTATGMVGMAYAPISYAKKWKKKHDEIKEEEGDSAKAKPLNKYVPSASSKSKFDKVDQATSNFMDKASRGLVNLGKKGWILGLLAFPLAGATKLAKHPLHWTNRLTKASYQKARLKYLKNKRKKKNPRS